MPPVRRGMIPVRDCGPGGAWTTSRWTTFPSRITSPRWRWSAARLTGAAAALSSALHPAKRPLDRPPHVMTHANLWRVSGDFWDNWKSLDHEFALGARWHDFVGPGHWPDADMLPVGHLSVSNRSVGPDRFTHFTRDEQLTHISLWSLLPSPLMIGANLPDNDDWTTALLTNPEVLAVNQDVLGQPAQRLTNVLAGVEIWTKKTCGQIPRRRHLQSRQRRRACGSCLARPGLCAPSLPSAICGCEKTWAGRKTLLPNLLPHSCALLRVK